MTHVRRPIGFFILPVIYTFFVWAPFYGIYHWITTQNEQYGLFSPWNIIWIPIVLILMLALNKAFLEIVVEDLINLSPASRFLHFVTPIAIGLLVLEFYENFQRVWLDILPDFREKVTLSDFKLYNNPPVPGVGFVLTQIVLAIYIMSSIVLPYYVDEELE